jgi:hypothetical protein
MEPKTEGRTPEERHELPWSRRPPHSMPPG